ncbi:glycogen synthase GlgA [Parathalassolituus penaei]|uniref:Glycogen synthase n=1 Tax=Parathalassolituus penaei TaxID=2997323 RepID=A0A9X3EMU9_9GAMM|nr:glycogen synthase GlgA [Parathalassolituus penaei]MCY0965593.1 glycogen synthase GlgA [Parathalassolituus penaei]
MKILFATSEIHPVIKTGGLADVSGGLPNAYARLGEDVRVVLPGYLSVWEKLTDVHKIAEFDVRCAFRSYRVAIKEARSTGIDVPLWIVDIPELFDRPGNPYLAADGNDWWDNGERFGLFARIAADLALDRYSIGWKADLVQANDWQTGLVPAFLSEEAVRPATIFTIHNMAYQGLFPHSLFSYLELPWHWWKTHGGVEFYGQMSMLKAGIEMSDWVTTVSPTYAREITWPQFAYGLEGVMAHKQAQGKLVGIINGIEEDVWNPATDRLIARTYSADKGRVAGKAENKKALLNHFGWHESEIDLDIPVIGMVGRLVWQKGIDLVLDLMPQILEEHNAIFVVLGSGDRQHHEALQKLAIYYPKRVLVYLGYSEALAHLVEAGSDMFLMPSRFEPCGLNQIYSLIYGTPPIVHCTGGLADTVVNATVENIDNGTATGFVFYDPSLHALKSTLLHALYLYGKKRTWQKLQKQGMTQHFGWQESARQYLKLIQ